MDVWTQFADRLNTSYRRDLDSDTSAVGHLLDFCGTRFDDIIDQISAQQGIKVRVTLPFNITQNDLSRLTKRLFAVSNLVVFSPAITKMCQMAEDSRLDAVVGEGVVGDIRRTDRMGRKFYLFYPSMYPARLGIWLKEFAPFFAAEQLVFLPMRSNGHFVWEYDRLHAKPPRFTEKTVPLVWQRKTVAVDMAVSDTLGCSHIFPAAFTHLTAVSRVRRVDPKAAALLAINVPIFQGLTPADLIRIKQEEMDSFVSFQNSILSAISEIPAEVENETVLRQEIHRIRQDIIDVPLSRLIRRVKRLERFGHFRAAGLVIGSGIVLLAGALGGHALSVAVGGTIGSVSLVKAYEAFLKTLEKREKALDASGSAYIGRLRLGH